MQFRKRLPLRRRPYKKPVRKVRKGKKVLVKLIKSVVQRTAEHKTVQQYQTGTFGSILQSSVLNVHSLGPSSAYMPITNSAFQDGRIGNKIRTVKTMLRMVVYPTPYNSVSNIAPQPADVLICIGRLKKSIASPTALDFLKLYQDGSGSGAVLGNLQDICTPFNRDYWNVMKKIVLKVGYANSQGSGASAAPQYFANNDYKLNCIKSYDITKCMAATYEFNDNDDDPQNSQTYIWYEALASSNTVFAATQLPIGITWTLDYVYTDV